MMLGLVVVLWLQCYNTLVQSLQFIPLTASSIHRSSYDLPVVIVVKRPTFNLRRQRETVLRDRTNILCNADADVESNSRRKVLKSTFHSFIMSFATNIVVVQTSLPNNHRRAVVANALQPRNEPLCSTGLFENFMEYKCTPIGDIQDEGIGKALTIVEEQVTDSLLSKLGVVDTTDTTTTRPVALPVETLGVSSTFVRENKANEK